MIRLRAAVECGRPVTAGLIGGVVLVPDLIFGTAFEVSAFRSLAFVCFAMGGFMLNDSYDVERDRRNHPRRPAARGAITPLALAVSGLASVFLGLLATSWSVLRGAPLAPFLVASVGVVAYSPVSIAFPSTKGGLAALISVSPLTLIVASHGSSWEHALLVPAGFLFLVGREILMDILDLDGDEATGLKTLAVRVGPSRALAIARSLQVAGWLLLAPFLFSGSSYHLGVTISVGALVALLAAIFSPRSEARNSAVIHLCWIPLVAAVLLLRPF